MRPALYLALAETDAAKAKSMMEKHVDRMVTLFEGLIEDPDERLNAIDKLLAYGMSVLEYGAADVVFQQAERQARFDELLFQVRSEF
jgi:hypothetical protein